MTAPDLNVFFAPAGVAVVGASRDPNKLGHAVVRNLLKHGYDGPVYPVNPSAGEILGLPVYASIAAVPDPVELAVLALPAPLIAAELEACGQRGVKGVIIISGGFREVGPEGEAREEAVQAIAARYGIQLLGPNCIGTIDTHTPLNTTFVTGAPQPGEIAFVSQSGAVVAAVIDWAQRVGVGFSRMVSLGNQAGVSEAEMLEAVAADDRTRAVLLYLEGVSDGRAFLEAASRVARRVPIIALKVGRGESGAQAVASHTGALAGSDAAYDAAFRRAGVLRARTLEEMLDWARALAWQPLPKGNRVAVLTNAGGLGILALDALDTAGMTLAPLTEQTREFLRQRVPPAASVRNPVDVLAGSGPATYALCLDALITDDTVDAVVVITAPQDWFEPLSLAEVVGEVGSSPLGRRKPVLATIMGLRQSGEGTGVLHRRRLPNLTFPERLGSTLAAMWQRRQWLDAQGSAAGAPCEPAPDSPTAQAAVEAGLAVLRDRAAADGPGWMSAEPVEALLGAYGIAVPGSGLAPSADHAVALAESVGYPVALKLAAEGVSHKTDVGGVLLGLQTPAELREGFERLLDQIGETLPDLSLVDGLTVQHMVSGVAELIVGVVRDPQFGPLVMAGTGGTLVELQRDVAFELAPLTRAQAAALLDRTAAGRLLAGFRGRPAADRDAVLDTICALAQIALDYPTISEIEINPLIVRPAGEGAFAVDARVRLTPPPPAAM